MNRTTVLLAALVLVPAPALAQRGGLPSVPQKLSLADAVSLANQSNPTYLQAENNHAPAAWGVRNAFASLLPGLSVNGSIGYSGPGSQTFLSSTFSQPSGTISSTYGLSLNWNFSGNTLMLPSVRKAQLNATDAQIAGAKINLRTQVEVQYLGVLQALEGVTQQQAIVKQTEEALRLAQARYDVGQGVLVDVRSAQVNKGRADVGLLQAQQAVTVAKLQLFQTIGIAAPDDPSVITLSDTFPVLPPHWTLQQLLQDADQQNPDLNSLKAQETSARWSARSAASQWLPSVGVSARWSGYTQQYTSPQFLVDQAQSQAAARVQSCQSQDSISAKANAAVGQAILPIADCSGLAYTQAQGDAILASQQAFPFNFTKQPFQVGLSVSMPIPFTDRFNQNLQVSQAESQADDAHLAYVARQLDVRRAVSQAYYALVTAYQTIGIQDTNRVAANDQLRLATERYRVGSGTFLDLLNAQATQQQAEHDYVNSVYQYHGAVANLEAAVGRSLR